MKWNISYATKRKSAWYDEERVVIVPPGRQGIQAVYLFAVVHGGLIA